MFEQVSNNSCFILRSCFVSCYIEEKVPQDRLEGWAKVSSIKFNKAECQVLPLSNNNAMGWSLVPYFCQKGC